MEFSTDAVVCIDKEKERKRKSDRKRSRKRKYAFIRIHYSERNDDKAQSIACQSMKDFEAFFFLFLIS